MGHGRMEAGGCNRVEAGALRSVALHKILQLCRDLKLSDAGFQLLQDIGKGRVPDPLRFLYLADLLCALYCPESGKSARKGFPLPCGKP